MMPSAERRAHLPKLGRRFRLNDEMIDKIIQLVEAGNYLKVAAGAVGIDVGTLREYRRRGLYVRQVLEERDDETDIEAWGDVIPPDITPENWLCYRLQTSMEQAEARAESFAVLAVRKHMPEQWTAAMTYLERRFPDRWRKRQTIEQGPATSTDGLDEAKLIDDPEAMRLLHDALERVARGIPTDAEVVETRQLGSGRDPVPIEATRESSPGRLRGDAGTLGES